LPGAEELFRRTERPRSTRDSSIEKQSDKSTRLQVASEEDRPEPASGTKKAPRHDEKITFYCTGSDLMALEGARLRLRAEHGVSADRGRIVRAALGYVLEDFEARGEDSILLHRLRSG
jgi:hypothetical protein